MSVISEPVTRGIFPIYCHKFLDFTVVNASGKKLAWNCLRLPPKILTYLPPLPPEKTKPEGFILREIWNVHTCVYLQMFSRKYAKDVLISKVEILVVLFDEEVMRKKA